MNTKNRFKKLLTLAIVVMSIGAMTATSQGANDIFSINFYSDFQPFAGPAEWTWKLDFQTLDEDGVDQVAGYGNWETNAWLDVVVPWTMPDELDPPQPIVPVTITSDQGSTAAFTFYNARNGWSLGDPVETGIGNDEMMNASAWGTEDDGNDGIPSDPWDLQILDIAVSDIPFASYNVICYFGAQVGQYDDGTTKFVLNGVEQDIVVLNGYYNGTFMEIIDSVEAGNFIQFEGLTDPTFTIQMWGTGWQHVGLCGLQFGAIDPLLPSVNAGPSMITWADLSTGEPVDLLGTVVNNDDEPQRTLTWIWTVEDPIDPNVVITLDPFVSGSPLTSTSLATEVTVVKLAGASEVVKVRMKLAATLGTEGPVRKVLSIEVYDNPCKASVGKGIARDLGDIHGEDCDTDSDDFGVLLEKWLNDYSLTEPMIKP